MQLLNATCNVVCKKKTVKRDFQQYHRQKPRSMHYTKHYLAETVFNGLRPVTTQIDSTGKQFLIAQETPVNFKNSGIKVYTYLPLKTLIIITKLVYNLPIQEYDENSRGYNQAYRGHAACKD
jgi:hypothetical protein